MFLFGCLLFVFRELSFIAGQHFNDNDCITGNGMLYNGTVSMTENGIPCQRWDSQIPHKHDPHMSPKDVDNNFCRNPDNSERPWCYTTNPKFRFEYCRVLKCDAIRCPMFTVLPSVTVNPGLKLFHFNTTVRLSCSPGYTGLVVTSTCQADQTWSTQPPICTPIRCTMFTVLPSVTVNPGIKLFHFNTTVRLSCSPGYMGLAITSTCLADHTWSTQPPVCTPILCNPLIVGEGVVINGHRTTIHFNEPVTLSCKEGFSGTSIQISCNHDGTWPVKRPTCSPMNCKNLNLDPHVKSSNNMPKFNDVVTLSCEEGYFAASISIKCDANGSWPSDRPNCTAITCSMLIADEQGMKSENLTKYNDNVTLSCKEGYIGVVTILKCNAYGFWPPNRPNCTEKSQSYKHPMEKRCTCMDYGFFGGILATFIGISAGVHIATCLYFRKRERKPANLYEDMQFKTVDRQNGSNEETYTELT